MNPQTAEAIVHAASDLLCGMDYPTFARENGGVETLTNKLRGMVDAYENNPDPNGWLPIETAPGKADPGAGGPPEIFVVIAIGAKVTDVGYPATSDPYCVWRNPLGSFARWPHPFPPTHWYPLPTP